MKKPAAKAYRFRLHGHPWMTYIGPVRNKIEAMRALHSQFDSLLCEVRLHPVCACARLDLERRIHKNAA